MTAALFLIDRVLDDGTVADVTVMLRTEHLKVAWARKYGVTLAPDARLTGGTEREAAMSALRSAGFEVIAVNAHDYLGDDDLVTIHQWLSA